MKEPKLGFKMERIVLSLEAEPRASAGEGFAVAVEAAQAPVGRGGAQNRLRVAAEAHGPVHPESTGAHGEELQGLGEENRDVTRIRFHTPRGASRPRP